MDLLVAGLLITVVALALPSMFRERSSTKLVLANLVLCTTALGAAVVHSFIAGGSDQSSSSS